ncbi:MAG: hypothetical protein EOP38_15445 [Rubrivivax sp.]|nr:MAG: hypothetical protein EOP38_15445 [Rubrivivax sp.]
MKEEFLQQLIAELVESQERSIRVIAAAAADVSGDRDGFAKAMRFHATRLGLGKDGPIGAAWIERAIADVEQPKPN